MVINRISFIAASVTLLMASSVFSVAQAAKFDGFGEGVPLESAARQIVPSDVSIEYTSNVDSRAPVSFSPASDWKSALSQSLAKSGLRAEFRGDRVVITKSGKPPANATAPLQAASDNRAKAPSRKVVPKPAKKPQASAELEEPHVVLVAENENATLASSSPNLAPKGQAAAPAKPVVTTVGSGGFVMTKVTPAAPAQPAKVGHQVAGDTSARAVTGATSQPELALTGKDIAPKSPKPAPKVQEAKFVVAPGYDLRVTIEKWAKSTGWTVNWQSGYKYQISTSATFNGDFVKAVSELVTAMEHARPTSSPDAGPAITLDFYSANKVVVVSNSLADEVN